MPTPNKKQKDLIELAKRGGRDSELMLLDKINELEDQIINIKEKISLVQTELFDKKVAEQVVVDETTSKLAVKLAVNLAKFEKGERGDKGDTGDQGPQGEPGKDGSDAKKIDEEKILQDVLSQIKLPEQKELLLDTPEQLRDKLEALKDDQRLDKDAVKGLKEEIVSLKELIVKVGTSRGGGGPNANAVQFSDLTSQCDGSLKEFQVPRHRVALMLCGTQFPLIYRNVTDFTTSNLKLTLTAEVTAPTTGQTLIFLYIK